MDRPLGYYLKQRIEQSYERQPPAAARGWKTILSGSWPTFAGFTMSHFKPTDNLTGARCQRSGPSWLEEVPVSLAFSERYFIQMDPDLSEPRASIWGMDNATTQIAVSVFVDRFLPRFLDRCATSTAHLSTTRWRQRDLDRKLTTTTTDQDNRSRRSRFSVESR